MEALLARLAGGIGVDTILLIVLAVRVFDLKNSYTETERILHKHLENPSLHCSAEKMTTHLRMIKDPS